MKKFLFVILTAFPLPGLLQAEPSKTNFVLIMCDDLGWGDVEFNGGKSIKTPHLNAMAANSLKFTRFYAASAVCSPTRGSVMTGRHPYRYGIPTANAGHMKPEEITLAELLKKMGYATGHFGKWHLGTLSKTVRESNRGGEKGIAHFSSPWLNGFEVCFSTEAKVPTYDPMLKPRIGASDRGWDYITDKNEAVPYGTHYWNEKGEMVKDNLEGDDSRVIVDRAIPFIEKAAEEGKPFLAVVWFHAPHLPVVAGPRHAKMYEQYDSFKKNYFGCVTAMDEQVGRIRKALREAGVADNTMVTFCSDNGPEGSNTSPGSAGIYRGRKRDLYEGGVRVPGLVEWPARIKAGKVTDYPAVTSDYLPTILEIVGSKLPVPRPIDGLSLLPVLDGSVQGRPTPIAFDFGGRQALSDNRYKLVYYPPNGKGRKKENQGKNGKEESPERAPATETSALKYQLYDLLEDPSESKDIASAHPEIYKTMTETLEAWVASCQRSKEGKDYSAD